MTPVDPAVLEPMIRPWVGTGRSSPRWHPTWVVVDGRSVLVIDVEPPRPGDPVLPLRKSHPRARAGTILVRNLGSVDPAGPADVDALSARAAAGRRRISVEVYAKPEAQPLRALRYRKEDVDAWVEQRRQALLRSLAPSPSPEPPDLAEPGARFHGIQAALSGLKMDDRTIDEYRDEVEAHLAACKEELFGLAVAGLMDKELARLQLGVRNRTDTNFPDVEIVLHIAGRVRGLEDLHVELPAKPRRFGTVAGLGEFRFPTGLGIPDLGSTYDFGTGPTIDNSGSVTITFPVVDLRPLRTADLDEVDLLVPADGATSLTATWTATSSGADGVAEGTLELPIHPEPVNIGDLLPPP
jgi:hypothetical protein